MLWMKKKITCPAIVLDAIIKLYLAPTGISGEGQRHAPLSGAVDESEQNARGNNWNCRGLEIGEQKLGREKMLILQSK